MYNIMFILNLMVTYKLNVYMLKFCLRILLFSVSDCVLGDSHLYNNVHPVCNFFLISLHHLEMFVSHLMIKIYLHHHLFDVLQIGII